MDTGAGQSAVLDEAASRAPPETTPEQSRLSSAPAQTAELADVRLRREGATSTLGLRFIPAVQVDAAESVAGIPSTLVEHGADTLTEESTVSVTPADVPAATSIGQRTPIAIDDPVLGLTAADRKFLLVTGALIAMLACVHAALLSGWGVSPIEVDRLPAHQFDFQIDINQATWVEWMQLAGIGELTARKIVEDRAARGPFASIDDVDRVPGIGPKTLDAIRPWLTCPGCKDGRGP